MATCQREIHCNQSNHQHFHHLYLALAESIFQQHYHIDIHRHDLHNNHFHHSQLLQCNCVIIIRERDALQPKESQAFSLSISICCHSMTGLLLLVGSSLGVSDGISVGWEVGAKRNMSRGKLLFLIQL